MKNWKCEEDKVGFRVSAQTYLSLSGLAPKFQNKTDYCFHRDVILILKPNTAANKDCSNRYLAEKLKVVKAD